LASHGANEKAQRYFGGKGGAILTFRLRGGQEAAKRFIDSLQLFSILANVGDAKSLVIHPATTTHQQLTDAERLANGVDGSTIRFSVGIEDKADIIADIEQALART
jgi:O-acetylhomoserine (thiol)-lyase